MTENLAGRGEGLAGLVGKWREAAKEIKRMYAHPQDYSDMRQDGRGEAIGECADELVAALEAAAPPSTGPDMADSFQAVLVAYGVYDSFNATTMERMVNDLLALATPSPQAPAEQSNAFSTTSARERSSATASSRFGVGDELDFDSWWHRYVKWTYRTKTEMSSVDLAHEAWLAGRRALGIVPAATQEPAGSGAPIESFVDNMPIITVTGGAPPNCSPPICKQPGILSGSPRKVGEDGALTETQVEDIHKIIERHSTDVIDYEGATDDINAYLLRPSSVPVGEQKQEEGV